MQSETAMQEYVKEAIENYKKFASKLESVDVIIQAIKCFDNWKQPEELLLKDGWNRIHHFPVSRVDTSSHFAAYFSREYSLKTILHFSNGELLAIDWYFDSNQTIRLIKSHEYETYPASSTVVPVGSLTLYSILKYHGNIEAAIFNLDQSTKDIYFRHSPFTTKYSDENIEYKSPPPPIDYSTVYSKEKFSELKRDIEKLSKQITSISTIYKQQNQITHSSTTKTQITDSTVRNQADGRYNQEYSQAHYTFLDECQSHDYFNNAGIPIGYYRGAPDSQPNKSEKNLIYYQGETHLITIAPTGSGKLTAVQIPTLMKYTGSMVVIDPKGQCAAISARQRGKLGQKVIVINPFEILKEEFEKIGIPTFQGCNPLAVLDKKDDNFVADVSALAEALVVGDDVGNSDPYWSNSARDLIACLIMYVCCSDKEKNNRHLPRVRELLTLDSESLAELMMEISKDKFRPMAQKAMRFTREESSNASVISTAISNTLFLDDPKLIENLKSDDFRFDSLKTNQKTTVYIILPAKFLLAYSQWFRLLITSGLDTLMSTHKKANKNVLFMLDEFPTLGRLSSIETAIGLARGYGIQIWMFLQDIHQLNHLYKDKAESFLANTGMQQYFIPNDIITAERISRRMGNTTLIDEKVTRELSARGIDMNMPKNVEISHKERPLNYPIEILSFHKDIQLVFFSGNANVVVMDKNYYYDVGDYIKNDIPLYDDDPYYNG